MTSKQIHFYFLNIGHLFDHLFVLIYATVAALALVSDWGMSYGDLVFFATSGSIALGLFTIPAGWIADKWSREGMMAVFFFGIGGASVLTSFAQTPVQISAGLALIGMFAAIYHPVGLALVVEGRRNTGVPLAVNGIWGNVGVGAAALLTGFLIDLAGWRAAFWVPGVVCAALGAAYVYFLAVREDTETDDGKDASAKSVGEADAAKAKNVLVHIFTIVLISTAIGGLIFQSTTFALPKVFEERLADVAGSATMVGFYAFIAFCVGAIAQVIVGFLADRYAIRGVFAGVALLQILFLALMYSLSGIAAIIVAVIAMMTVFGQIPLNDVLVGRIAKGSWRSRLFAIRYMVTFSVAAATLPFVGWLHNKWGFGVLFTVLAISAAVTLVAVLTLPKAETSPLPSATPAE